MSDYACLSLDECIDALVNIKNPLILIHLHADGDAVGSSAALATIFASLGTHATIGCPDGIPDRLKFVLEGVPADIFSGNADGMTPISVDVASKKQLGALGDAYTPVLMIDHHSLSTPFAPHYVRSSAAAAGEIVYDIAMRMIERGILPSLPTQFAACAYAAIASDSGGFRFSNTTPHTMRAAADLLQCGIDGAKICRLLFESKSEADLRAEALSLSLLKLHFGGRISSICFEDSDRAGLSDDELSCATDIARSVAGVEVSFTLRPAVAAYHPGEDMSHTYRASIRSTELDVTQVAAVFGGGGHIHASGCSIHAKDVEQARDILLAEIEKHLSDTKNS